MTETVALRKRQWVSLPGGSCDVRLGNGVLEEASPVFKGAVGRPRVSVLLVAEDVSEGVEELTRRQLTDAGFSVVRLSAPAGRVARNAETAFRLMDELAQAHVTADDLMVAVGDTDVLSLASYVCAQWCGSMPLAMVPTGLTALLEAPITPRGIDVGDSEQLLKLRPSVKHSFFDMDIALSEGLTEDVLMARVLMVATAMCDSETAFSHLWDRAEGICANDGAILCEQLQDTLKSRGKIVSSTALALRQSLTYGESFAAALMRIVPDVAPSVARAEALRFQARLSAGEGQLEVDDVLAQDEILDQLEIPYLQADIDPQELIAAVRSVRLERSNRFLLELPRKLGRVRLASVSDELIGEHVAAWCATRAK